MKRKLRGVPSPSMVVALIALFVALGGSAYAVKKIGTNQIRAGAVTTGKIAAGAVTNAKVALGSLKADRLSTGARKKLGLLAYATVDSDGTLVSPETMGYGIAEGAFTHPSAGVYCLPDAPAGARTVMVSPSSFGVTFSNTNYVVSVGFVGGNPDPGWSGCGNTSDEVRVTVFRPGSGLVNQPFTIWFDD